MGGRCNRFGGAHVACYGLADVAWFDCHRIARQVDDKHETCVLSHRASVIFSHLTNYFFSSSYIFHHTFIIQHNDLSVTQNYYFFQRKKKRHVMSRRLRFPRKRRHRRLLLLLRSQEGHLGRDGRWPHPEGHGLRQGKHRHARRHAPHGTNH